MEVVQIFQHINVGIEIGLNDRYFMPEPYILVKRGLNSIYYNIYLS